MILKRGINATDYFECCSEVGCDIWGILVSVKEALYESVGLCLPPPQPERLSIRRVWKCLRDYSGKFTDRPEHVS